MVHILADGPEKQLINDLYHEHVHTNCFLSLLSMQQIRMCELSALRTGKGIAE